MDSNDYGNPDLSFIPASVDYQDVKAEAALRTLETGKTISLKIIYNEMANKDRMLYYGTYHRELDTASPPWCDDPSAISQVAIERLIDWALEQKQETQDLVFDFLDALSTSEKEEKLGEILRELGFSEGDLLPSSKSKPNHKSMSDIMLDALPSSKDELIQLIQAVSIETKRPAATVRQWARSKTKAGVVYLGNDDRYHRSP